MSDELATTCPVCGRMKAPDGYRFCGGSYCLREAGPDYDPADDRLIDQRKDLDEKGRP